MLHARVAFGKEGRKEVNETMGKRTNPGIIGSGECASTHASGKNWIGVRVPLFRLKVKFS